MMNSKRLFIGVMIMFSLASSPALAVPILWGVDEQDGMLFSLDDYTTLSGLTEYGPLKWNDRGRIRTIGDDIEAFTLDADGTAYLALDDRLGHTKDQVLLHFDLRNATTTGDNVVTVLGRIAGGCTGNISGLSIHPVTGELYALDRRKCADQLLKISKTDGSLITNFGTIVGAGERVCDGEDLEFDSFGNLYVTDNQDDHLYRVDPGTATILQVVDRNEKGGLGFCTVKFEGLAWDPENQRLIGTDDRRDLFAQLTLETGNNLAYGRLAELRDVEGMDFAPIPEPATLILLSVGGLGLMVSRRRNG